MILEFKAATSKAKKKNCSKGYPCGGGCINRQRNCKKPLGGQAGNFADWLKKSSPTTSSKPTARANIKPSLALPPGSKGGALALRSDKSDQQQSSQKNNVFALPGGKERVKKFSRTDPSNFDSKGNYRSSAKVTELITKNKVIVPAAKKDRENILKSAESARKFLRDTYEREYKAQPEWLKKKNGKKLDLDKDEDLDTFYQQRIGKPPKPKKTSSSRKKRKTKTNPNVVNGVNLSSESNAKKASPWKVFGLSKRNATRSQVKKAFGELALKYHPDVGGDPQAMRTLIGLKDRALANFGESPNDWDWYAEFQEDLELYDVFYD